MREILALNESLGTRRSFVEYFSVTRMRDLTEFLVGGQTVSLIITSKNKP